MSYRSSRFRLALLGIVGWFCAIGCALDERTVVARASGAGLGGAPGDSEAVSDRQPTTAMSSASAGASAIPTAPVGPSSAGAAPAGAAPAAAAGGPNALPPAEPETASGEGDLGAVALPPVLVLDAGAVAAGSNEFGIQGQFTVDRGALNAAPIYRYPLGSACISGRLEPVALDASGLPDYVNAWGLELVLPLAESATGERGPWNRGDGRVVGFSFRVTGPAIPEAFRFVVRTANLDETYCVDLVGSPTGGSFDVTFDEMQLSCWSLTGIRPAGDLTLAAWQLEALATTAIPYDFCISELRPMLAEAAE